MAQLQLAHPRWFVEILSQTCDKETVHDPKGWTHNNPP